MMGVYKITSPSGKVYVGSSNDIANRVCSYKGLKCKNQRKLYNSIKKYTWDEHVFEILEECSVDILLERELFYGLKFNVLDKNTGLNCRLPKAGESYSYMSEETKTNISKANKNKQKGKKHAYYDSSLKKLTIEQVIEIKKLLAESRLTQKEIGSIYGVHRKTIGNLLNSKTYSYVDIGVHQIRQPVYVKLSNSDIYKIINMYESGVGQKEIGSIFGVCQSAISRTIKKHKK